MHRQLSVNRRPGSVLGPCLNPCRHTACHAARRQSRSRCPLCDRRIGYGRPFADGLNKLGERVYVHAKCLCRRLKKHGAGAAEDLIARVRRLADHIGSNGAGSELAEAADRAEAMLRVD